MRRGIASALVSRIAEVLRARGAERLEVTANPHAMEFYRAAGFTACGVAETPFGAAPRMVLVLSPLPDEARDQGPRDPRRDPEPQERGSLI